jgi:hypothetical protein
MVKISLLFTLVWFSYSQCGKLLFSVRPNPSKNLIELFTNITNIMRDIRLQSLLLYFLHRLYLVLHTVRDYHYLLDLML